MKGDDTRFLTGTDEHSVNIAESAARRARTPASSWTAWSGCSRGGGRAADRAGPVHPDHGSRPPARQPGDGPSGVRNGDVYLGKYEGWYCPNEGFKAPSTCTRRRTACAARTTRTSRSSGSPSATGSSACRVRDRLVAHFEANPDWVQPEYRKNEMLSFLKGGLEDISISRETFHWGIPFPIAENGETASARTARGIPRRA
jgi:methionyl-tRNA synthetase